jgi:hypothetical protein
VNANLPARHLSERPDLDQLKRQAKELLAGFAARESSAQSKCRQSCGLSIPAIPMPTATCGRYFG